jgi:hypothetical protein
MAYSKRARTINSYMGLVINFMALSNQSIQPTDQLVTPLA